MIATIHQPHYWPWLRYFAKIASADYFVIYDDVQYQKNGWIHRTKIRAQNEFLLTIPVHSNSHSLIKDVLTVDNHWKKKHIRSIEMAYRSSPFFNDHYGQVVELIQEAGNNIAEINIATIRYVIQVLGLNVNVIRSSNLNASSSKTTRLINICKELNCDTYLSGKYAMEQYINIREFENAKIRLTWGEFLSAPYSQNKYKNFVSDLSIIDLLMNHSVLYCKEYLSQITIKEAIL